MFRGINGAFTATRYHSLVVARDTCPRELEVTAESRDGLDHGAVAHRDLPIHGVQFHPESILSEQGGAIVRNFLDLAAAWNRERRDNAGLRRCIEPRMDAFKPYIAKVGDRRRADARGGPRRLRHAALRRGHARPRPAAS